MLFIDQPILKKMIAHVEPHADECCGFLFGIEENDNRIITKSIKTLNYSMDDRRVNFAISAGDYLNAEFISQKENLIFLGVYHSHPNHPAIPSEFDRVAAQPYFSYLIFSVVDKKVAAVRSWQLDSHSQFEEEKIETIQINH